MKETQKTFGFRLDSGNRGKLEARAKKTGVTPSELAREIIVESLNDEKELDRLRLKVSAVEGELSELRKDFSVAIEALLAASGKVTPEQAKEWVRLNLKRT